MVWRGRDGLGGQGWFGGAGVVCCAQGRLGALGTQRWLSEVALPLTSVLASL